MKDHIAEKDWRRGTDSRPYACPYLGLPLQPPKKYKLSSLESICTNETVLKYIIEFIFYERHEYIYIPA